MFSQHTLVMGAFLTGIPSFDPPGLNLSAKHPYFTPDVPKIGTNRRGGARASSNSSLRLPSPGEPIFLGKFRLRS